MVKVIRNPFLDEKPILNTGNHCFANAVIQVIISIPEFVEFYKTYSHNKHTSKKIQQIILDYEGTSSNDIYDPQRLFQKLFLTNNIFDGNQQDAHEFFIQLIEQLYLDLGGDIKPITSIETFKKVKKNNFIADIFYGLLISEIICNSCHEKSIGYVETYNLSLPVFSNIDESLKECFRSEHIERTCDCGVKIASKQISFVIYPNVLILHISRFNNNKTKDITEIQIEERIGLGNERYELIGSVIHVGSLKSGHYTCYALRNKWSYYDDELIRKSTFEKRSKNAYLLFYKRVKQ